MRFEQTNSGDAGPTASSRRHSQTFPLCGRYLINFMNPGALKGVAPKRWETFVKWCGNEDRAIEACTWGKGPLVQINSHTVGKANGKYKHGDTVFVHGKVADAYESGDGWVIWESTVLHELIHWARFQERLSDGNVEVGQEFEMEAYGEHIELTTKWKRSWP
jgi:Metallopeptidase toxin 3